MATVVITVSGGVADVAEQPPGVDVVIRDYDVEGVDEETLSQDADGQDCIEAEYPGTPEERPLYSIVPEDVRMVAQEMGFTLTDKQFAQACRYVERGLDPDGHWHMVCQWAIEELGIEPQEQEICCECGQSVAPGSGKWANRVPEGNGIAGRRDMARPYPAGAYVCADCDAITSDD